MILAVFWENPAVVGLILAIPATALGYLGYRRSLPVDKAVKQVGEMAGHIGLINALQEDNKVLRERVERVEARLDKAEATERRLEIAEREIVVLHVENEAWKVENEKLKEQVDAQQVRLSEQQVRIDELERINGP